MTEHNTNDEFALAQTGPVHYTVKSIRSGQRAHRVNVQDITCSCEDMTFNKNLTAASDSGREICDHIAAALEVHPQLNAAEQTLFKSMGIMEDAASLRSQIQDQSEQLEKAIVQLRDAQAGLEASNDQGSGSEGASGAPSQSVDKEEEMDKLQEAFDGVTDEGDMNTQLHNGYIWINKTPDAPDWTFDAWLKEPELVEYDPDNGPGQYWKNRIDPDDVEEYISEVIN